MLNEFKKLKTLDEKILYLDTIGNTLLKVDYLQPSICDEILVLDYYLDSIDFWDFYDGCFFKVAERIEILEQHRKLQSIKQSLSTDEQFKLMSLCRGIFYYDRSIIMDVFDGENREIASILISNDDSLHELIDWQKISAEKKLIEMMKSNGHVDIRYDCNSFVIKTMH